MSKELREYIEARSIPVPFVGCWMWLRSFGSHGYGSAHRPRGDNTVAHRVSFEAFKGPIPDGMLVQHSCDNKWCVNPDHLSLGTDATNALDKQIKGRAAKKLSLGDVVRIVAKLRTGAAIRAVAREFGIHQRLVQRIARKEIWRHAHARMRSDEPTEELKAG